MANIMGILGGVGQGISAGVQDLERMEEAKNRKEEAQFRKELQQRERERIAEEKRVGEQIKGIQAETPAEYDASMSTITKPAQKLSRAQMLARQAEIYSASPDRQSQMLGLQLSQASRAEESADRLKSIQTSYADTVKAINADPNKWVQENLAKFNSDEYGGPGTKGFVAAPMSTAQGTVLNIYGPQGQQASQIPVTRQDMMRVAKSMYFDDLASVDPKYAELAMKQEQLGLEGQNLGLKRQANETDAQYKSRVAGVYERNAAVGEQEFTARKAGGMYSRAPERFEPLGLGDNGRTIFGTRGGVEATLKVPEGFEGSFPKLQPKSTRPVPAKVMTDQEGNTVAYSAEGRPLYNIVGGGLEVPLGVTSSDYNRMVKESRAAKIPMEVGSVDGKPVIAYQGRDGQYYSTLDEAKKAKAKAK
jgi:hypothetical protein